MYGRLRREPRREWVSTLEAVADVLPALGEPEEARDSLQAAAAYPAAAGTGCELRRE